MTSPNTPTSNTPTSNTPTSNTPRLYFVSIAQKANYLLNNDTFYVIKNIPTNTYIEPIIMGHGYIVHDNWLEATWWTNEADAQSRIAESVSDIYKVVKITFNATVLNANSNKETV